MYVTDLQVEKTPNTRRVINVTLSEVDITGTLAYSVKQILAGAFPQRRFILCSPETPIRETHKTVCGVRDYQKQVASFEIEGNSQPRNNYRIINSRATTEEESALSFSLTT